MPITNTFIQLERKVLTTASNAVSFTSINSTYTDLYLMASARTDSTSTNSGSNAVDTCYVRLNDVDIQKFKFKYPIFIQHFNRYFYVDEISEYTGKNQSTKIVLMGI
jgi:hypothetical protein